MNRQYFEQSVPTTQKLPLLLAGPIVRQTTVERVWFWFASSKEMTSCHPTILGYDSSGKKTVDTERNGGFLNLLRGGETRTMRLGNNLWIILASAVPNPKIGQFPTDTILGYNLDIDYTEGNNTEKTYISDLNLEINYPPFTLPTFVIGKNNKKIAHGSCRRPGASGEDAFGVYDQWMVGQAKEADARPASLILTGDQIYADDVAIPLFEALHKLAFDVFGYTEMFLMEKSASFESVDNYSWKDTKHRETIPFVTLSDRESLTHRLTSPIGFTTEDGEAHLMSFAEYAAMYLIVWNPELCIKYNVDNGTNASLKDFAKAVKSCRRVMANTATYMIFDDHDITDDWNLDEAWENKTKSDKRARRIIANGLAAYWCFQGWGNEPNMFDQTFMQTLSLYFQQLITSKGYPRSTGSRSPYDAAGTYEKLLLGLHWSFMAATNPKALCVDTRTRRETPAGKTAILSGKRVWPYLDTLLTKHGFRKGETLLLVLPTPFLPHRSLMYIQNREYNINTNRYEGDFEFYGNNPQQRAELILWLQIHFSPSALVILSGDVHHGSVVTGRYGYGKKLDDIRAGKADWVMRVVQITSSPIKNVKSAAYEKKRWWTAWQTDAGNVGESLVSQWEYQYATISDKNYIAMQATSRKLTGNLGRETYIFENHLCVVQMPYKPKGNVNIDFIGVKNGKGAKAYISVDTDNDPANFKFTKVYAGATVLDMPPAN